MYEENNFKVQNKHILHSSIFNPTLRSWQGVKCEITPNNLMYPLFIVEDDNAVQPINSMPGISRYGINKLKQHLESIIKNGLQSVLLFGVIENLPKDDMATHADSPDNPVIKALPKLKSWFPHLTIACDVCLCPYSSHGHCGVFKHDGTLDNTASVNRISDVALAYAKAGADIIAPSDMMDGRIGAIKTKLVNSGLQEKVAVLSYTAKFASSFYGPFRHAAMSKPAHGDRKCYQLPPSSTGLAIRAAERDIAEGSDMLMVKPAMIYLDILKEIKGKHPEYPMFAYQVSGEYDMIYHTALRGDTELKPLLMEVLESIRRAGADVIISYFTPIVLEWLRHKHKL